MAKRIIDNEDDSNARTANQKALEEIENAEREEGGKAKDREPNGPITVEVPDEEEEEAVREAGSRNAENRRNRYREQKEGRERAERERDELAQRVRDLESRFAQPQPQAQQQQPVEQKNQYVEQEKQVRQAIRELSEDFENLRPEAKNNVDVRKRFQDRYSELTAHQQRLNAIIATGGGQQPQNRQAEAFEVALTAKYPDVDLSPGSAHRRFADATCDRLIAAGARAGWETIDKAIEETRRQFRLGKAPLPSAATRARFSGVSSGSSGAAAQSAPTKVELSKEERTMARAMWPKLKEKDAFKEFAKMKSRGADA